MKTITIEDVEKKDINRVTILDIRPEDAYWISFFSTYDAWTFCGK